MPHAERAGAEAGNVATGLERVGCAFRAVKDLEPVAARIVEHRQVLHMPFVGRARAPRATLVPAASSRAANGIEGRGVGDLRNRRTRCPGHRRRRRRGVACGRPCGTRGWCGSCRRAAGRAVRRVFRPIVDAVGAHADISESFDHRIPLGSRGFQFAGESTPPWAAPPARCGQNFTVPSRKRLLMPPI